MRQTEPHQTTGYFDSSALVKQYLTETGTPWVQAWCDDRDQTVAVADIGLVEVAAAFAGKLRGGFITPDAYKNARIDLERDAQEEYVLVAVTLSAIGEAIELTSRYRLRGYDAVHLACAVRLNRALLTHHLPPSVFIASDADLLAALTEGMQIDTPSLRV